jgi:hypothetical protein
MFILLISSASLGVMLGLRFKVVVLLPGLFLMMLFVLGLRILRAESVMEILLAAVVGGTALQLGYLCGAAISFAVATACPPRPAALSRSTTSRAVPNGRYS